MKSDGADQNKMHTLRKRRSSEKRKESNRNTKLKMQELWEMFSRKLLKKLAPDYVIGTGGYVCGPVLREAAKLGIKTAVHEANSFPGVTIKMLASVVDRVMVVNEDAANRLNCKNPPVITGNPIRSALTSLTKTEARKKLGIPMNANVVLSFGGSLGARALNEAMLEVIKWNMDNNKYYILHITKTVSIENIVLYRPSNQGCYQHYKNNRYTHTDGLIQLFRNTQKGTNA